MAGIFDNIPSSTRKTQIRGKKENSMLLSYSIWASHKAKAAATCYLQANHNWVERNVYYKESKGDGQPRTFARLEKRPRIAKQDEINIKEPFTKLWVLPPSRAGPALLVGIRENEGQKSLPRGKELGAMEESSVARRMVTIPLMEPPPHLPQSDGTGRGHRQAKAGGARRDPEASPPPPPSQ